MTPLRLPQMAGTSEPRYSFSGHQTFPFRYAWLPKGIAAVREDPEVFSRQDALVTLGVGKNMVLSIRHWCEALGLTEFKNRRSTLTSLGELLFGSGTSFEERPTSRSASPGFDPYLEDQATLWLLHWRLASRPFPASTWFLAFTCWSALTFTRDELSGWLLRCTRESRTNRCSINSIKRDVDVFLRTYLPASGVRRFAEDSFDCPLAELGLIRRIGRGQYSFERTARPSLPDGIFAFALAEYWTRAAPDQKSLALERALYDPGSPGAVFKLGDQDIVEILERLPGHSGLHFDETAGQRAIIRHSELNPLSFLKQYYKAEWQ